MEKFHVLQYKVDNIRFISESAMKNIIREIQNKKENKIVIKFWSIEDYPYWFYLLNTLKANKGKCISKRNNYESIDMKKIFELFTMQLSSMYVDGKLAFNEIMIKDESLEIECSDYLYEIITNSSLCFAYEDELRHQYNYFCI